MITHAKWTQCSSMGNAYNLVHDCNCILCRIELCMACNILVMASLAGLDCIV